jgi:soluble lytic murein transglycosylase-like protein
MPVNPAILLCVLAATLFTILPVGPAYAVPSGHYHQPTRTQLDRLNRYEPYVRYFTSLTYGPNHARVSADYIRALILVESAGLRMAESNRGARGLTQILPETALLALAELAREGRNYLYVDERVFRNFDPDDLYDPALNILIACHLSASYHAMYDGDTELIVSAWNAGPGAVARYGNRPPPYNETQGMIGRILRYLVYLDEVNDL